MKTETEDKEIEITEIQLIGTTGDAEAQFKVVFEYREAKGSDKSEGGINETKLFNGGKTLNS